MAKTKRLRAEMEKALAGEESSELGTMQLREIPKSKQ